MELKTLKDFDFEKGMQKALRKTAIEWAKELRKKLRLKKHNCKKCKRPLEISRIDEEEFGYQCPLWDNCFLDPNIKEYIRVHPEAGTDEEPIYSWLNSHTMLPIGDKELELLSKIDWIKHFFNIIEEDLK